MFTPIIDTSATAELADRDSRHVQHGLTTRTRHGDDCESTTTRDAQTQAERQRRHTTSISTVSGDRRSKSPATAILSTPLKCAFYNYI